MARPLPRRERRSRHRLELLELDLVDVDDVVRSRRGIAVRERCGGCLDVPWVVVAPLDPRPPDPDRARPRQPADLRRVTRSVDEVVETVRTRDERVLVLVRAMDDAVERAHLVHFAVLPREARASEHEEDLLRCAVGVRRSRQLPRRDAHAVDADADGTCRGAEPLPRRVHLAFRPVMRLDVIPMHNRHSPIMSSPSHASVLRAPPQDHRRIRPRLAASPTPTRAWGCRS